MFTSLFMVAAIGFSGGAPVAESNLPADVSSKIALYLLVSTACDQMVGSNAGPTARATSSSILRGYGFTSGQVDTMFNGFIGENLSYYIDVVTRASGNREDEIRYFCSSMIEQKQKAVDEIKAHNLP